MVTYRFNPPASTISAIDIQQKWSCLDESKSRYISEENKELMNQHYTLGCSDRNIVKTDTSVSDNIRIIIGAKKVIDNGKTKLKLIQTESIFTYLDGVFIIDIEKIPKLNGTRSFISLINSTGDRINIINQINEEEYNQFNFFSSCDSSPSDALRHNDDSGIYVCRILNNGETIQYWFFEEGSDGYRILKDADNKDIKFPEETEISEVETEPRQHLILPSPIKTITNTCTSGYGDPYRLYIGISLCEFENGAPHPNQTECLLNINPDFTTELNWVIRSIKFYGASKPVHIRDTNWPPYKLIPPAQVESIDELLQEADTTTAETPDTGTDTTITETPDTGTDTTITETPDTGTDTTITETPDTVADTTTAETPDTVADTTITSPPADAIDWDAYEDKVIYIFLGSYVGIFLLFLLFSMIRKRS